MIVTKLKYHVETRLVAKLDKAVERLIKPKPKLDCVIIFEGDEGAGKSTILSECFYYIAEKTNRNFSVDNVFLDPSDAIRFAKSTDQQIIAFDEPALAALSTQWQNQINIQLIQLLMIARKKRHLIGFCFTKFFKFSEYIVVDRARCMIHVYQRDGAYRFRYIPRRNLEKLFNAYRKNKKRLYFKLSTFGGSFPDALDRIIDINKYDAKKDKAIMSIGENNISKDKIKMLRLMKAVASIEKPIVRNKLEYYAALGFPERTISRWRHIDLNNINNFKDFDESSAPAEININNGNSIEKKSLKELSLDGE